MFTLIIAIFFTIPYTINFSSDGVYVSKNTILLHYMKLTYIAIADGIIALLPRLASLVGDDIGLTTSALTSDSSFSIELDDDPQLYCFLNQQVMADNNQYSFRLLAYK